VYVCVFVVYLLLFCVVFWFGVFGFGFGFCIVFTVDPPEKHFKLKVAAKLATDHAAYA